MAVPNRGETPTNRFRLPTDPWLRRRPVCPVCKQPPLDEPPSPTIDDDEEPECLEALYIFFNGIRDWIPCGRAVPMGEELGLGSGVHVPIRGADAPLDVDPGLGYGMPPRNVPVGVGIPGELGGHGDVGGVDGGLGVGDGGAVGGDGGGATA